jgi:primosomal protein N'
VPQQNRPQTTLCVAVDAPLWRGLDYLPPPGVDPDQICPGQRITVPLGRRETVGVVLASTGVSQLPKEKLKRARALVDSEPVVDRELLALLEWASNYYQHPIGQVLAAALPTSAAPRTTGQRSRSGVARDELGAAVDLDALRKNARVRRRCSRSCAGSVTALPSRNWRISAAACTTRFRRSLRKRGRLAKSAGRAP